MPNYMVSILIDNSNCIIEDISETITLFKVFKFHYERWLAYNLWHLIYLCLFYCWSEDWELFLFTIFLSGTDCCLMTLVMLYAFRWLLNKTKLGFVLSCMFLLLDLFVTFFWFLNIYTSSDTLFLLLIYDLLWDFYLGVKVIFVSFQGFISVMARLYLLKLI